MALDPTINLCLRTGCNELVFSETTGIYNASSNLGGYGTPNPVTGNVISAVLTVISPSNQTYTINLFTTTFFPTSDTTFEYTLPLAQLGNRTIIEDGQWQFIYTIVTRIMGVDTTYIANTSGIFTCNSTCCVQELLLDIDEVNIDSKENIKRIDNYKKASSFLAVLKYYANCSNLNMFNNIKLILDKLCANNDCKTCK